MGSHELSESLEALQSKKRRVLSFVRLRLRGISEEILEESWSDTVLDFIQSVRSGTFDLTGSNEDSQLSWFVLSVYRRSIDRQRRERTLEKLVDDLASRQAPFQPANSPHLSAQNQELLALIRQAIRRLPTKQKVVLQEAVSGNSKSTKELALAVSQTLGANHSTKSVERALQEARKKIRSFLSRRGFGQEN